MSVALHPTRDAFSQYFSRGIPQLVWATLPADLDTPVAAMLRLMSDSEPCFLLESVEKGEIRGRYSVIGLSPDVIWRSHGNKAEIKLHNAPFSPCSEPPLVALRKLYETSKMDIPEGLPPMAAGLVGYMGYDMVRQMEELPTQKPDALNIPDSCFVRPQVMVIFDSVTDTLYVITACRNDAGVSSAADAYAAASSRIHAVLARLSTYPSPQGGEGGALAPGEGNLRPKVNKYGSHALIPNARELRSNMPEAEKKLWYFLRAHRFNGYKFRRQHPISKNYIADFICLEKKVIIELDGAQHGEQQEYDAKRTTVLEKEGYKVLRFWNNEVFQNIEMVLDNIWHALESTPSRPSATLPPLGGGESVALLTGSIKGREREEILDSIANGNAQIIIGTHALFQEKVQFKNLALVVIDEQHRFGVEQRMALSNKGNQPHILHMTATPIPRSLMMTLYGDMETSLLKEKPAGRKPITTRAIPAARYDTVVERLKAALERGEKAYWICPLIESGDDSDKDLAAAKHRFTEFKARFGPIVGLIHGRMKKEDRDAEMQKFVSGKTKLLVATTVIEVGVDVRDATIMVIEQAERFGLSQLHQLRGRVGRGDRPSACALLYNEYAVMPPLHALRFSAKRKTVLKSPRKI